MGLIKVIIFVYLLFVDETLAFQVSGVLNMENTTDMLLVSAGDSIFFTFNVKIDLPQKNQRLLISIAGDTLEFQNETQIQEVNWWLSDSAGNYMYTKGSSQLDVTETVSIPINRDKSYLAYLLNITGGLDLGEWTFNGNFRMSIVDDITGGSLIRGVMTITVALASRETSTSTLVSKYYIVPIPQVTTEALSPMTQPIMGLFTGQITVQSTRDVLDCVVHVYTSPETTSKEVRLTVQKLLISTNDTSGTTPDTMFLLENVSVTKESTLGSYQNNMAVMKLPNIPIDANSSEVTVASDFTVRVEDYSELESGDKWPVEMGVSFSGNLIWVGSVEVNISAPKVSSPDLEVQMQQTKECAYNGNSTAVLQVLVRHSKASTGTAYNVSVNVYLPDYMTMRKKVFTVPLENTITVRQDMNIVTAEIARLTFSDPFTLGVTLDLDLSSVNILMATNRIVTVEAVCSDRWGNVRDILSNTGYLSVDVDRICSKRFTWTNSSKCTCTHDSKLTNCACCVADACQCGPVRPQACAPCEEQWRCVSYKEELSPRVAVVTGINSATGFLYGISNNGLAYVISKDGGTTWTSITDDIYTNVVADPLFIQATVS